MKYDGSEFSDQYGKNVFLEKCIFKKCFWNNYLCIYNKLIWISACMHAQLLQLCPTLCNPMDYSPPGSLVHGIFQARILEWVAMPFSRGSSWPRDQTHISWISCFAGRFFAIEPPGKPKLDPYLMPYSKANSTLNKLLSVEEKILKTFRRKYKLYLWHSIKDTF